MSAQIETRRTHRGGFVREDLSTALVSKLQAQVRHEGTALWPVTDPRARLGLAALPQAGEQIQQLDSAYVSELARWAPAPGSQGEDGVHPGAYPREPAHTDPHFPVRDFARGMGWGRAEEKHDHVHAAVTGTVMLLMTSADTRSDRLRAGMALQRLLLCAAQDDVSAAFHTQALEIDELRALIRSRFCDVTFPQMLLRIGTTEDHPGGVRRPRADITRRQS